MRDLLNIRVDFLSNKSLHRLKTSTLADPLLRAVGLKRTTPITVLDLTAGFGQDACLLAYHGAKVTLLERVPQMGELLQQGLLRAQTTGELMTIANQMTLIITDAKHYMQRLPQEKSFDVIYLDPMFIHKKSSALPNKNMQFLQQCADDSDADELLPLALTHAKSRVVVKRALKAPLLANFVPDLQIKSKLLRFDVFLIK